MRVDPHPRCCISKVSGRKPSFKPESIDSLLEKAASGEKLIGQERKVLRTYLKNTLSGAGNSALRPVVQERISPISANVMRFLSFLDPAEVPFFMIEAAADDIPGLSKLLENSDNPIATILSILEPLERSGLLKIDRENEGCSTTQQIQDAIKDKDYS